MFEFKDGLYRPTGEFHLEVYKKGELIEIYDDHNLVVDTSKQQLAHLLGGDTSTRSITQIGFGTGSSAPAAGNTSLTAGYYANAITAVTYPVSGSVNFAFALGTSEANGLAIIEFGLFCANGTLFARKTRSAAIGKDTDLTLSGSWTITF